ncbi:MAG: N-acetylmuramoyl-L-alanine amidase, partial [Proteobacteria bacterium]
MRRHPFTLTLRVLVGAWLLLAAGAVGAASVAVEDVRLWAGPDGTRVVFDLSGAATYTTMTLKNPDRVVIDIASARLANANRPFPEGQGFVSRVRAGPQANGALRLVLDLSSPATSRTFTVGPDGASGHRLVVDLSGTGSASASTNAPLKPVKVVPASTGRDVIVAIDAGHGGVDPGAIGRDGTREKDVTLAIARRLKARIDREPGMRAVLTRDSDIFLAHRERIRRARSQQADMFISVHADAFHDRSVAGSSVYVLSARGASDEAARWLAERENAADLLGGVKLEGKDDDLQSVLLDLS